MNKCCEKCRTATTKIEMERGNVYCGVPNCGCHSQENPEEPTTSEWEEVCRAFQKLQREHNLPTADFQKELICEALTFAKKEFADELRGKVEALFDEHRFAGAPNALNAVLTLLPEQEST